MRSLISSSVCMLVLTLLPSVSLGADDNDGHKRGADAYPASVKFSIERVASADVDDTEASTSYMEYAMKVNWWFLLFNFDHRDYDWTLGSTLGSAPSDEPWGSLTRITPGLQYYKDFGNGWGVWVEFWASAGFEDDISSRSWTYNPQAIAFYKPGDSITLFGGVGTLYHPADSVVYPVLGIAWNDDSRLGLSGAVGFPKTLVRYRFTEKLALRFDYLWDTRTYQLSDDNTLAPSGYLRMQDMMPGLHLEYSVAKRVKLNAGVRRFLGRDLTIFDRDEKELARHNIKASSSFSAGLNKEF